MKTMKYKSPATVCVQSGGIIDEATGGVSSPIYPSTAIDFISVNETRYPRYYNTPNQKAVAEKLAQLENGKHAIVFSSGLAAIMTAAYAILKKGDHAIFQNNLYGGTQNVINTEFPKFDIEYTFVDATDLKNVEKAVKKNTKLIYIETPSNPILKIVDVKGIARIAKSKKILSMIDNTFASPINQRPLDMGIDISMHSGTKYLGGHSDLICGALIFKNSTLYEKVKTTAVNYGGTVNAYTCYLLERSLKTLALRVEAQNKNAMALATFLEKHPKVKQVFYPGLKSHQGHNLARKQMSGFGGMVSFEVKGGMKATNKFISKLRIIKPAVSLGGVETILSISSKTSHAKLSSAERKKLGISEGLMRLSVGIEGLEDLKSDLISALK